MEKNTLLVQYPERVDSLMVANACSGKAGWVEWGYQVLVNPRDLGFLLLPLFGFEKAWTQVHNLNQLSENLYLSRSGMYPT